MYFVGMGSWEGNLEPLSVISLRLSACKLSLAVSDGKGLVGSACIFYTSLHFKFVSTINIYLYANTVVNICNCFFFVLTRLVSLIYK
jgi:hypothetical protein